MTFENGVATFTLKDGEKAVAEGLPTTVTYTVEEAAADGFTTEPTGNTGEISTELAKAAFTNTRELGDLEVTKTVESDLAADADVEFEFTVTLGDTTISGTYGDMEFTDGVATFKLKGGESAKAEGLPTTVTYTVVEAAADGFTTEKTGDTGEISTEASTAAFTNTRELGDLEVTKTVSSDKAADADVEFEFTVTLGDTTISGTYGDMEFTDGVATFTLKGGETKTATGLPTTVTYTVVETAADGFTTEKTGDTGAISTELSTAAFTNTREQGGLKVTKTVVSDRAADKDVEFEFTVTLDDKTISGTYGEMTFENGVATFKMKGGETRTATGLPTTVKYTVAETEADGFETDSTGTEGEISTVQSTAAFTNTRETAELTISKKVVSDLAADETATYTYTVTLTGLSDEAANKKYGDVQFTNGVATIEIVGSKSVTIPDLPTEVKYTVEETAVADMTTTADGDNGEISSEAENKAEFTNTRDTEQLKISKQVVSDLAADEEATYTFTVTLTGLTEEAQNKTYSDVAFSGGVGTVEIKGSASKTIEGLPIGVEYKVEETAVTDMTTTPKGDSGKINSEAESVAQFTNKRDTSALKISKQVVSDLAADEEATYTFTVTLTGLSEEAKNKTYSDVAFSGGVGTVEIKGSASKTIEGLPIGVEYKVEETAVADMTTTPAGDSGTINSKTPSEAKFTNERDKEKLIISKEVVSDLPADEKATYTFTVTLTGLTEEAQNKTYSDVQFSAGVGTVEIIGSASKTIEGLPIGVEYKVEEAAVANMITEYKNEEGTINSKTKSEAVITNTHEVGDLIVTKTVVTDKEKDATREFEFTVTLSETAINGTYGDMTFENGVATFTLKGGESATATGLPTTVEYTVEEAEHELFRTEKTDDTGVITTEPATAAFTNIRKIPSMYVTKICTSKPANGKAYKEGETITYLIMVTNDGDLTIKDIVVTDELTNDTWIVASLAPGETSVAMSASYVVTRKDAEAGHVLNVATAIGKDPGDEEVPGDPAEDDEPTMIGGYGLVNQVGDCFE